MFLMHKYVRLLSICAERKKLNSTTQISVCHPVKGKLRVKGFHVKILSSKECKCDAN